MSENKNTIYTIGHSTRNQVEFVALLQSFEIEVLADVRRYPGSKKYPHFNVSDLEGYLPAVGIDYMPFPELGGRRKPKPSSANTVWRSESFRGYADYAETPEFEVGVKRLTKVASEKPTAYMCSEAVWWRCHRAIISDYLKERGWTVVHILSLGTAKEHPFTAAYLETHKHD